MPRKLVELPAPKHSYRRPERNLESARPPAKGPGKYPERKLAQPAVRPPEYLRWRRGVEAILAVAGLAFALPLFVCTALLVKLTSRGPAIYAQARVGRNGRVFIMYKFRTMVHNCESLTGPRWAIPGDPRITPVGQFLRLTHLDELPQLWNVVRGDMSLVGPRPERPEFVQKLRRALPHYEARQAALPGITGLAQIQLPPDTDLDSVRRKLACDLYYLNQIGPWLDLRILLGTVAKAVGIPFAIVRALLRIPAWQGAEGVQPGSAENLGKMPECRAA